MCTPFVPSIISQEEDTGNKSACPGWLWEFSLVLLLAGVYPLLVDHVFKYD